MNRISNHRIFPFFAKIIFTIALLQAVILRAQPTITSNNLPKMYDRLIVNYCPYANSFNTIDSGGLAFWDASDLVPYPNDSSIIDYIKVPAGYASKYPKSTICKKETGMSVITYEMFSLESEQYYYWGNTFNFLPINSSFSNAQLTLKFPFTFNSTLSDNFSYNYRYNTDSGVTNGNSYTRGAGYGKLKLPNNISYNNALLVITNSYWQRDNGQRFKNMNFEWYVPEYVGAILTCNMNFDYANGQWNNSMPSIWYQKSPLKNLAGIRKLSNSMQFILSPNPVVDVLKIESKGAFIKEVQILNSLGQIVQTSLDTTAQELNVSNLPKGAYTLVIKDQDNNLFQKKFIK